VPEDHLLRRIAAVVDFSFVRPLCRPFYSRTGQPSVDPVVLFKMLLVGYLYGIPTERRLAQEVRLNLAYRWFLGYDLDEPTPHHSVLSKARARFTPDVFEAFFRRSIDLCHRAGLLIEGPVYVDSTLIRAGASVDSLVSKEPLQAPLSVAEYLRRLDQEAAAEDKPPPSAPGPTDSGTMDKPTRKRPPNQLYQSRTDPEATLVNRPEFGRHLA
jgi:transposase